MSADQPVDPALLDDAALRRTLLACAAASTTALSVVDTRVPALLLDGALRAYLRWFETLAGTTRVELYFTLQQEAAVDRLGLASRITGYHLPWEKGADHLGRLLETHRSRPLGVALHLYEWLAAIDPRVDAVTGQLVPAVLDAHLLRTEPLAAELDLLERAAAQKLVLLFETVVDREFYDWLTEHGIGREEYLFTRVEAVRRLHAAWWARCPGRAPAPVGIAFNPWHAAMEMHEADIRRRLRAGTKPEQLALELLPLLERLRAAAGDLIRRFYAGNSRPWDLHLPEMLQRGRFLDPGGIVPELPLLRACLRENPAIADNITLEAPPQAALFSWIEQYQRQ